MRSAQLIACAILATATAAKAGTTEKAPASTPATLSAPETRQQQPARAGKPNIIYILLDDVGFSDLGSFGSEIATPNLDRLAADGLRYNAFHTRAICSPSRAALLTGRNSHSVGMGNLTHVVTDAPGKRGQINFSAATAAEILRPAGYNTFAAGKWHLVPMAKSDNANDKSHWPLQRGFDQYFGFIGGMTEQFDPELILDNTMIPAPQTPGYHFTTDMVDRSIRFIQQAKALEPEQPFFLYFAPGAMHHPHHAPAEFIEKYDALYTKGWDSIRAERFERQKKLGLIPANTKLTPRSPDIRPWSMLTADEKKVAARFQAVYAGFLEHTDAEIGRLLEFLERAKLMDNTIIVLTSDNGASGSGGELGSTNQVFNEVNLARKTEPVNELVTRVAEFGTDRTSGNYGRGWAMVSNTPFSGFKASANEGGARVPLIVSWPEGIKHGGAVRSQFVDIIDITPTVLEVAQVQAPVSYRGVPQQPLEGASIAATFANSKAPDPRSTQYFELQGQRAIWHEGWKAVATHTAGKPFEADSWALYNLRNDFSASTDVAAKNPQMLTRLQYLWQQEAGKFKVLPLDDRGVSDPKFYTAMQGPKVHRYLPGTERLPFNASSPVTNTSYSIEASVDRKDRNTEGVLIAAGDRFGGYVFYLKDNRLHFDFNDFGKHSVVTSDIDVPAGKSRLGYHFRKTGDFQGVGTLTIDGRPVGSMELRTTPTLTITFSATDIGMDVGSPVSDAYAGRGAFAFPEGQLKDVVVNVE